MNNWGLFVYVSMFYGTNGIGNFDYIDHVLSSTEVN